MIDSAITEATGRIIKAVRAVPRGKVSCYRDVALAAGASGAWVDKGREKGYNGVKW